ncbi:MAG: hypothetical protein LQ343_000372 [Gyalolechia ehrenbergii]|nr:MAG: hypothetical protein LQ343_000372 [Gyalolechia ehrenbergii]
MASAIWSSSSFIWINSLDGRRPGSPSVRTQIRRQAMSSAVAERKRRSKLRKHNLRHYPINSAVVSYGETESEIRKPCDTAVDEGLSQQESLNPIEAVVKRRQDFELASSTLIRTPKHSSATCIPASPSSTGYEAMRIRYDFDVLDLSALTALHIERTTAQPLQDKPSCLLEILRYRQWSYFSYMPWRYGHTRCLDDALCCVAARVRQWITKPGRPDDQVLVLYSKAVKSLQAAIDDPIQRMQPDVLCAVEVLSIFQLLDTERWDSWTLHAAGAANLIRLRGPGRYETNFEKALFLAQVGPIITEATLDASPCFLEEPAWQRLFQTVVLGKSVSSSYSDVFVRLWACISAIPGLTRNTRLAIRRDGKFSRLAREQLRSRIFDHRSRLMRLGVEENLASVVPYGQIECSYLLMEQAETELRYDILGVLARNLIRLERLIVALDSSVAISLEAHVQELARNVLEIERAATAVNPRATLSLTYKVMLAKSALLTGEEWRQELLCRPPNATMNTETFDRWIGLTCPWRVSRQFTSDYLLRDSPPLPTTQAESRLDGA